MPKESLILNNFSGGVNTLADPRDIQGNYTATTDSSIEGRDAKKGELAQCYNGNVSANGTLTVSGSYITSGAPTLFEDLANYVIVPGQSLISIPSDYSYNILHNSTFNVNITDDWTATASTNGAGVLHDTQDIISIPGGIYLQPLVINPSFGDGFVKSELVSANATNIELSPVRDNLNHMSSIQSDSFNLFPGKKYTLSFDMRASHPCSRHGDAYPPFVEISGDTATDSNYIHWFPLTGWQSIPASASGEKYANVGLGLGRHQHATLANTLNV